ncbi:hypothetical protein J2S71_001899 [Olsenella profusa DSM 13989]|uniref:PF12952 domain protein n=1 Tax=Olsenella profusa F0195 TaxID=1125712 RepID=U2UVT5_9ACTN|nr:DUF3841 domain-containing protein [Olsenella profusa]ERL07222.1 PF12952 domain protein [Olsenella profusa F0195]MDP9860203.1 hypothetical protein [Olsenella profusa DSM 13989]
MSSDGMGSEAHGASATKADTIRLWTAQAQVVLDTLEREGVYRVKMRFVDQKFGDTAWIFRKAYQFYVHGAERLVPRPEGSESAIWCYRNARWATMDENCTLLQLEVPRDQVVLFDLRSWNRILNLQYIPLDGEDEHRWRHELKEQGITNMNKVFQTPMYPFLRRKVESSWERLFTSAQHCEDEYLQAGLWELRPEWIVLRVGFGGDFTPYAQGHGA